MGVPDRDKKKREKGTERMLEEMMAKKFPTLIKDWIYASKKINGLHIGCAQRDWHWDTAKNLKDKEKFESSNREATCHIQEILNTINMQFIMRNHGGWKAVG